MSKDHHYTTRTVWTGNRGAGTANYRAYDRDHEITAPGVAPPIPGSSDPAFRGDPARYNPEQLFLASLSACHMLWFLHLASAANLVVTAYTDEAAGVMTETADGGGRFTSVTLRPQVTLADSARAAEIPALHERAHGLCFLANSVNFPVVVQGALVL